MNLHLLPDFWQTPTEEGSIDRNESPFIIIVNERKRKIRLMRVQKWSSSKPTNDYIDQFKSWDAGRYRHAERGIRLQKNSCYHLQSGHSACSSIYSQAIQHTLLTAFYEYALPTRNVHRDMSFRSATYTLICTFLMSVKSTLRSYRATTLYVRVSTVKLKWPYKLAPRGANMFMWKAVQHTDGNYNARFTDEKFEMWTRALTLMGLPLRVERASPGT